ncbi:MAG: DinB family protein [Imperialibacter sp.]|uniref:DinB family protein n=1 Tax=Imperialibacter sp. TaxID=2038411 RepID=UPI0032ED6212
MNQLNTQIEAGVISPEQLLKHWQGHRSLTRRVIEAFPEKEFFEHSIGGMRPFSKLVSEMLAIAVPGLKEIVTGKTTPFNEELEFEGKKENVLKAWDESTEQINVYWKQLSAERFQEQIKLFGQYEGTVVSNLFYFIDNEIHHRGQGYVYLRSLDIQPPFFWER